MEPPHSEYYAHLQDNYDFKIHALVPRYDEMVDWVLRLLTEGLATGSRSRRAGSVGSCEILDIGPGTGALEGHILEALPEARVTAVEACDEMFGHCLRELERYGDRVRVLQGDVLDYRPDRRFQAIFSNLVLHNLPHPAKTGLIGEVLKWLVPGGLFVWGDLIRHESPWLQDHFVRYRIEFARSMGCPEDLLRENFRKEMEQDFPLSPAAALRLLEDAGYHQPEIVWQHDTFAIFVASRPPKGEAR